MRSIILALGALPALALAAESFPTCYAPREENPGTDGGLLTCDQMGMVACGEVCIEEGDVCCQDLSGGCPSSAYCLANTDGEYECCPNGEECGPAVVSSVVPSSVSSIVSSSPASSSVPASSTDDCEEEPISSAPVSSSVPASASASASATSSDDCSDEPISSAPPMSYSVPASTSASATSTMVYPESSAVTSEASASATSAMVYPESSPVTSEAVSYTTSTICSTNIYTVTKCTDTANLKYCPPYSTTVITDIIPISTTVCAVTPTVSPTTYGFTTSTVYATTVHTVTSCAPNAGYCPAKSTVKVTDVYAISTTVCAITATTEGPDADYPSATAVPNPGADYPKDEYEQPAPAPYVPAPPATGDYPKEEHEQPAPAPAPYVPAPAPVEPTKAHYPAGPEKSAYAPVPGAEYPAKSGGAVAPYPGVAQPTTFHPTAKYTSPAAIESQYPVTAGVSGMFGAVGAKVVAAVVVGAAVVLY